MQVENRRNRQLCTQTLHIHYPWYTKIVANYGQHSESLQDVTS